MADVYNDDVKKQLETLQREFAALNMSQRQIAEAIGYSSAVVNQIFAKKYEKPDRIIELMVGLLRRLKSRQNIVPTTQFKEALDFFDSVYKRGMFGVMLGASGLGKSFAGEYYAVTNDDVAYCLWLPSMNLKEMLYSIADSVVSSPAKGSLYQVQMEIIKALRARPRMLIIDEADLMPEKMANIIRSINDDGNCSIALCGMPILETILKGGSKNTAYVYSRIKRWRTMGQPKREDILRWAEFYNLTLSDELTDDLLRWIGKSGEYRMLNNLFSTVADVKDKFETHDDAVRDAYTQVLSRGHKRKTAFAA